MMTGTELAPPIAALSPTEIGHQSQTKLASRLRKALELQDAFFADAMNEKNKPAARVAFARVFLAAGEYVRVLQGKPLPGAFRPDLDPVQLRKALRRAKLRAGDGAILDIAGQSKLPPPREPEETAPEPKAKVADED